MKEIQNEILIGLGVKYLPRFKYFTTEDGKIYCYTKKNGFKEIKPIYDPYKLYNVITLSCKKILWHRVILSNYVKQPKGKMLCNHKNGNKLDNRLVNLERCNGSYNIREAQRLGLKPTKKLYQFTEDGQLVKIWNSINDAIKVFGLGISNTYRVNQKGITYTRYKGFRRSKINKFPPIKIFTE